MGFNIENFRELMLHVEKEFRKNKGYLIELDAAMGDGDLGLTMEKAFIAFNRSIADFSGNDIGKAIFTGAMAMAHEAAATMGTLFASGLMYAGKSVTKKEELSPSDLLVMGKAMVEGISHRGKAKLGDKTILDSLIPFINTMEEGLNNGESLDSALQKAVISAEEGVERTKGMVAKFGRAHYYGEKARGKQDPGATVGLIFVKAMEDFFQGTKDESV